ncbi:hypothetical protein RI844_17295 [Thalassotalea fonticola]|uniref:Uncharacterized protein n=1 Tax=Thalassotalea fonticola TaxID=3065649 RepID=A0ABZ0GNG4_9GAMM|nr:hypothetical protein RI844_17295 [Colwelliaceae bacterium S1-1]
MTFFKSLLLAIIATLMLTYAFGISLIELFNVSFYMGHQEVEPLKVISLSAIVAILLVFAALAIVLSVFGTIIFSILLVCGGVLMVGVGVFWPIILIAVLIWACTRQKTVTN